jgi:hypothetical protein
MVAGMLELLGSGCKGESDFEDSEEAFFEDSDKTLFSGFPFINNLAFGDVDDLVKALYLVSEHLSHPERLVHETLSSLDGDEFLAFTKEESESAGHILA